MIICVIEMLEFSSRAFQFLSCPLRSNILGSVGVLQNGRRAAGFATAREETETMGAALACDRAPVHTIFEIEMCFHPFLPSNICVFNHAPKMQFRQKNCFWCVIL